MLSDHGKENNFSAMVCVIPYRLLDISVQEHINMQPQAAAFLWLVAHLWWPSLNTDLGARSRVGQLDCCGEPKVGCVWYLMMDQLHSGSVIALDTASWSVPSACSTQVCSAVRQRSIFAFPGHGQEPLKALLAVWSSVQSFLETQLCQPSENILPQGWSWSPPDRQAAIFYGSVTIKHISAWLKKSPW